MIRALACALCLSPTLAVAQDWTYTLRLKGGETASYSESGSVIRVGYDGDGAWNGSEIFQSEPSSGDVDCASASTFEMDHYVGLNEDYVLQLLVTFARQNDGNWTGMSPDLYYDVLDATGEANNSYFSPDGVVKVQSLTCDGDDATIRFSFRGDAATEGNKSRLLTISGTSTVTLPVFPYSDY